MEGGGLQSERDLVHNFRINHPETFAVLCRMHLSFLLDLGNEEFSPLLEGKRSESKFKRKLANLGRKPKVKEIMHGAPLTAEGICRVYQLIKYLERDFNISQEGLFRKTGSVIRQQELKALLNAGAVIDLDAGGYSVHDCASVLRGFLSEMSEPLLTDAHFSMHCKVPELYNDNILPQKKEEARQKQLKTVQLLLLLLPLTNYSLLKDLLMLLHKVSRAREDNCMDARSLATMFTPHILCPRKMLPEELQIKFPNVIRCVTFLIENAPLVFEAPPELVQDVVTHIMKIKVCERSRCGDDSSKDGAVEADPVNTLITFCDRTKAPPPAMTESYTSHALADLYAYVQGMPENHQKKKLIKQFNKENGCGVPLTKKKHQRSKTFGDSVKKHVLRGSMRRKPESLLKRSNSTDKILAKYSACSKDEAAPSSPACYSPWRFLKRKETLNNSTPSVPKIAKTSTPLGRSVLRASRRVKDAVLAPRNREAIAVTPK